MIDRLVKNREITASLKEINSFLETNKHRIMINKTPYQLKREYVYGDMYRLSLKRLITS